MTYSYQCQKCGVEFEVTHGMNEEGPRICTCGGALKRLLYAAAGWIVGGPTC